MHTRTEHKRKMVAQTHREVALDVEVVVDPLERLVRLLVAAAAVVLPPLPPLPLLLLLLLPVALGAR